MSRVTYVDCFESLPANTGALQDYHADLILELIVERANNNEEECDKICQALHMIELAIAALEAEVMSLKRSRYLYQTAK